MMRFFTSHMALLSHRTKGVRYAVFLRHVRSTVFLFYLQVHAVTVSSVACPVRHLRQLQMDYALCQCLRENAVEKVEA